MKLSITEYKILKDKESKLNETQEKLNDVQFMIDALKEQQQKILNHPKEWDIQTYSDWIIVKLQQIINGGDWRGDTDIDSGAYISFQEQQEDDEEDELK